MHILLIISILRLLQLNCYKIVFFIPADEILFFSQKDLVPEHVALLDAYDSIYIWTGKLTSREEKRLSAQNAVEYLETGTKYELNLRF